LFLPILPAIEPMMPQTQEALTERFSFLLRSTCKVKDGAAFSFVSLGLISTS
jgi:hypothetical protein